MLVSLKTVKIQIVIYFFRCHGSAKVILPNTGHHKQRETSPFLCGQNQSTYKLGLKHILSSGSVCIKVSGSFLISFPRSDTPVGPTSCHLHKSFLTEPGWTSAVSGPFLLSAALLLPGVPSLPGPTAAPACLLLLFLIYNFLKLSKLSLSSPFHD